MKLALSTDHAGFEQLKKLKLYLENQGYECIDFGPGQFEKGDDYPDFIRPAAKAVASGEATFGIILGGSGQGEAMTANRIPGVRCAVYYGPAKAVAEIDAEGSGTMDDFDILRLTRQHNDANMLSLAARFVPQQQMEQAVSVWLDTPFSDKDRHVRRVKKMDQLEA